MLYSRSLVPVFLSKCIINPPASVQFIRVRRASITPGIYPWMQSSELERLPVPFKTFPLKKIDGQILSCNSLLRYIYFYLFSSLLAGLINTALDFFFFFNFPPMLEQRCEGGGCKGWAPPESPPPGPLPGARRGVRDRDGRKLSWWVGPNLHLPPRRVGSLSLARSLASTHKHHRRSPSGRRSSQPKEAGLQEESPRCA